MTRGVQVPPLRHEPELVVVASNNITRERRE